MGAEFRAITSDRDAMSNLSVPVSDLSAVSHFTSPSSYRFRASMCARSFVAMSQRRATGVPMIFWSGGESASSGRLHAHDTFAVDIRGISNVARTVSVGFSEPWYWNSRCPAVTRIVEKSALRGTCDEEI
jgi:hypothetical protein